MKLGLFLIVGFAPLYIISFINFFVDPYEILQTNFLSKAGFVQERFYKINYLKNNNFEEIIIGSSRAGTINTENLNKYFNRNIYNFYISSGNINEFEYIINWIPNNLPTIKTVYIQVDWPENFGLFQNQLFYELHPDIIKKSTFEFYKNYLFSFNIDAILFKIKKNYFNNNNWDINLKSGYYSFPLRDVEIKNNCLNYQEKYEYFKNPNIIKQKNQKELNLKTLESIRRIKEFGQNNNLNIVFFTTPHNHKYLDSIDTELFISFINEFSKITPFVNFSFYNKMTLNNCNYYETSHYTNQISLQIFKSLFSTNNDSYSRKISSLNIKEEKKFLIKNFYENQK